jgi:hypothetical protein
MPDVDTVRNWQGGRVGPPAAVQHPRPQHRLGGGGVVADQEEGVGVVDVGVGGRLAVAAEALLERLVPARLDQPAALAGQRAQQPVAGGVGLPAVQPLGAEASVVDAVAGPAPDPTIRPPATAMSSPQPLEQSTQADGTQRSTSSVVSCSSTRAGQAWPAPYGVRDPQGRRCDPRPACRRRPSRPSLAALRFPSWAAGKPPPRARSRGIVCFGHGA